MTLEQQKANAREKLDIVQLDDDGSVVIYTTQADLDEVIEATHQAAIEECVRVAEGMQEYTMFPGEETVYIRKADLITTLKADK